MPAAISQATGFQPRCKISVYGNYKGQFCFIGMEEGSRNSLLEINNRLNTWVLRGECELEDLAQYYSNPRSVEEKGGMNYC